MCEITKSYSFEEGNGVTTTISCFPDGHMMITQTIKGDGQMTEGQTVSIRCSPEGSESLRSIFCNEME